MSSSRPVPVGVVDTLVGTMDDIGATAARIFSHSGFTPTAIARADKARIVCTSMPFEERHTPFVEPTGVGFYTGDSVPACGFPGSGPDLEGYGRVNYDDGRGYDIPLCVGYSLQWGTARMREFVAHIVLTHHLGRPPSDAVIAGFVEEFGGRLVEGRSWEISEAEVWHHAAPPLVPSWL